MLMCNIIDSRRHSLYEQQRDTFIGQAMTEIWAFQQIVFGLGDSSDSSTISVTFICAYGLGFSFP